MNSEMEHRVVRRSVSVPTSLCANIEPISPDVKETKKRFDLRAPFISFIRSVSSTTGPNAVTLQQQQQQHSYDDSINIATNTEYYEEERFQGLDQFTATSSIGCSSSSASPSSTHCHRALLIPEILRMILIHLDQDHNIVPHEQSPKRRSPMSLRHALLLYGDNPSARQAWRAAQLAKISSHDILHHHQQSAGLHSCQLVNKTWHEIATEVLYSKLHFKTSEAWNKFVATRATCASGGNRSRMLVLHKIHAQQQDIESLESIAGNLQWLEFYTCPGIVPTRALLQGGRLTKIVLPGCSRTDDRVVKMIAENSPQLEFLDLRACEQVSDKGLRAVAKYCRKLKLLNVGRTQGGELITHRGVKHIVRRCNVDTLGLAGCAIDDRTIWEVALRRGSKIERLSLNNCSNLTNASIPRILGYTLRLSVLELRGCTQITDMRPIVLFKKYRQRIGRPPLIEGCEVFELRIKEAEWALEMEWSRQVFKDCLEWIYADDDDVSMQQAGLR